MAGCFDTDGSCKPITSSVQTIPLSFSITNFSGTQVCPIAGCFDTDGSCKPINKFECKPTREQEEALVVYKQILINYWTNHFAPAAVPPILINAINGAPFKCLE